MSTLNRDKFTQFAKLVLSYTVIVILWGAFVRATGSGAGCGAHWPLCNGEIIPHSPDMGRIIEFSHRLSSGLCLALVIALVTISRRVFAEGHLVRRAAIWALVFIIGEALVGGMLVLLKLVAGNDSGLRAIVIGLHLLNSFFLLFWLARVVYLAKNEFVAPTAPARSVLISRVCIFSCMVALAITGMAGAIAALGDTLFPVKSLADGLAQDFAPAAHYLIKLRKWHPIFACFTMLYLAIQTMALPAWFPGVVNRRLGTIVFCLVIFQVFGGFLNLILLAPVWMQLFHLLTADVIWIALCFWYFSTGQPSAKVDSV
jgi:heme a synthase